MGRLFLTFTWLYAITLSGCYDGSDAPHASIDRAVDAETFDGSSSASDADPSQTDQRLPSPLDASFDAAGPTGSDGAGLRDQAVAQDAGAMRTDQGVQCRTPERLFERDIWPNILSTRCQACHSPLGVARSTRLVLIDPVEAPETYLQTNFERTAALAELADPTMNGRSILELKPTMLIEHGGREVLVPNGPLHQRLQAFVSRVNGEPCDGDEPELMEADFYRGLTFQTPVELLRRVSMSLLSRPPSAEQVNAVRAGGMPAFQETLETLFTEPAFLNRIQEGFDDLFLTRGYDAVQGALLAYAFYSETRNWVPQRYEPPESWRISELYDEGHRRSPTELIKYIVRNDRPFTEILTADYTVVSPYTARGYGVFEAIQDQFSDPEDPFEFIATQLPAPVHRNGQVIETPDGLYPHAGILTMPQFVHRYPNTDTNRNRARARVFFDLFLGFDVMGSAPIVADSAAVTARFENPTLDAPDCVTCHQIIDPVAGLFQAYDNRGDIHFRSSPWYADMLAPGFAGDPLPEEMNHARLRWLGQRAATDPRFATAMAEHVFYILTQEPLLEAPQEGDANERAMRTAYMAQREIVRSAAQAFAEADYNLKALFRSFIMSRFYRVKGLAEPVDDPVRLAELEALGLGALLTPEQLLRRVESIFGYRLPIDRAQPDQRRSTYLLYGGIDFKQVTERAVTANGSIGALMRIHAHLLSCKVALKEFWGAQAPGVSLFPEVDHMTSDEPAVRANLVWLHSQILGQFLDPDDPEIDRTYRLFATVVAEGAARVASGEEDRRLVYDCRAEQPAPQDPDYLMRGWQAVIHYLVLRPEFLLQ